MNLRKVIDVLERHLPLTAGDKRVLDTELLQLEGTVKDVGSTIGPGGRATQIVSGNVLIGQQYGLWITNPDGGAITVALEPDGDVKIGSDTNDVTRTGLSVFSHDQRYNGENLGEGDILFGDNSTSKANMIWDRSIGQLRFRSGQTDKITIGTDGNFTIANQLRSSGYVAGSAGFLIDGPTGDAEFNNITARGSIICSVFVKNMIEAKAGSLMVAYSAGVLHIDMTVPTSGIWAARITDPPGGGFLFQNNDICKVKEVFATSVIELFFTVSGRYDMGDGTQSYTCTYGSGDRSVQRTYTAGLPVVDMGQSGQGYLYMTADDTGAPYYSARSWVTNPWTAGNITERARLGNMYGAFGTGVNNRYGFGVGDYAGGNYLSYNAEIAGGFILKGGDGNLSIDGDGLTFLQGATSKSKIKWKDGATTFFTLQGYVSTDTFAYVELKKDDDCTLYLNSLTTASDGANINLFNGGLTTLRPSVSLFCTYSGFIGPTLTIGFDVSNNRFFEFANGYVKIIDDLVLPTDPTASPISGSSYWDDANNRFYVYRATATPGWKYVTLGGHDIRDNLSSLLDTNISSPSNNQVLTYNSTSGKWENKAGGSGGESENIVRTTSDVTNSTTTFADVTGLTFAVAPNTDYIFEAWLIFQSNTAACGIKFAVNGPASPTAVVIQTHIPTTLTALTHGAAIAYNSGTASASVAVINTSYLGRVTGIIRNGANSGTLAIRFAAETTGIVKIMTGSVLRYRQTL